jgi:AraC-like DNA-binding protein
MTELHRHDAPFGFERFAPGTNIGRHVHAAAYAAIVLDGGYEEAGSAGRMRMLQGHVALHDVFDSHCNRFFRRGGRVFNLPLSRPFAKFKWARVADPDAIVNTARKHRDEAEAMLAAQLEPAVEPGGDWPDILCATLAASPRTSLTRWAQIHGLARETLSRQFGAIFGTTPASFRAEARARNALREIVSTSAPLAQIAARNGFSDQAHMTRAIRALTGHVPSAWRTSHSFKTA